MKFIVRKTRYANVVLVNKIVYSPTKYRETEGNKVDITVSFANEYGQKATLVLYGVEILNEGTGYSIDNVTTEKACTFVARKVDYMRAVTADSVNVSSAADGILNS